MEARFETSDNRLDGEFLQFSDEFRRVTSELFCDRQAIFLPAKIWHAQ